MAASMTFRRISLAQPRILRNQSVGYEAITSTQCRYKTSKRMSKKALPTRIEKPKLPEKFLQKRPIHSVYMLKDYPQQYFAFDKCVEMHKEAAQPWMLDCLDNRIFADIELDLSTKKQTKFMPEIRGVVSMPHKFDTGMEMKIAVMSEAEEDLKMAEELGAETVGDANFIKQIHQGLFDKEDIKDMDFFLCTRKLSGSLTTIRSKLHLKTPAAKNNTISSNVIDLLKYYLSSVMYESKKISESQAVIRIPIGQLNQETSDLEENFKALYDHLIRMKPPSLTPYVDTVTLVAPPSQETFHVNVDEYLKAYTEEKQGKDKNAKMDEDDEESDDEEEKKGDDSDDEK